MQNLKMQEFLKKNQLVIDLGEKYLKVLWYKEKYFGRVFELPFCISQGDIINASLLEKFLLSFIIEMESIIKEKIKTVLLSISFIDCYSETIYVAENIGSIVKAEHINLLEGYFSNNLIINEINFCYKIDGIKVMNPIDIYANNLSISGEFFIVNYFIPSLLVKIFRNLGIIINELVYGPAITAKFLQEYKSFFNYDNRENVNGFNLIDFGNSSIRLLLNNKLLLINYDCFFINSISYEEGFFEDVNKNQKFILNLFTKIFHLLKENFCYKLPTYFIGGLTLIPFLDKFIEDNLGFKMLFPKFNEDIETNFNVNFFFVNIALNYYFIQNKPKFLLSNYLR